MIKGFDDLWILTDCGISIFNINNSGRKVDPQLFAMLMSAVNSYSKTIVKGGISKIELLNKRFDFLKENDLIFITCSDSGVKEKNIEMQILAPGFTIGDQKFHLVVVEYDSELAAILKAIAFGCLLLLYLPISTIV